MTELYVRVGLGDESYALPVEHVTETAEADGIAPIPGAPAHVAGVCNLRGELLPVFDLAGVLDLSARASGERLVVLEHGMLRAGLVVDEVADVGPLPGHSEAAEAELLAGAVLCEGTLVGVVDVPRLFEKLAHEGR